VEGTGSAVGREERRVAVVTAGVVVDRVISLCLLRSLEEWLWGRVPSLSLSGVLRASMISSCAFDTECCVPLIVTSLSVLLGMFLETVMWAPEASWMPLILVPLRPITRPTRALDTVICSVLVVLVTACQAGEEVVGGGGGGGRGAVRGAVSVAAISF
jgi:hypothetical protein